LPVLEDFVRRNPAPVETPGSDQSTERDAPPITHAGQLCEPGIPAPRHSQGTWSRPKSAWPPVRGETRAPARHIG